MRTSAVARLSRTGLSLSISTLLMSGAAMAQSTASDADTGSGTSSAAGTSVPKQLDQVVVRGDYIPEPMLQTSEVASFVTREDMERTGDSSAAVALTRVTGLSLSRGKYVYVRGLGERYSSALFNGSPLPSPEPMQRVVPLDLFPSDVLASVTVQKTYSADYPGEFGGGVIDLQSMAVPDKPFLSLTVGGGANSVSTGEKGLTYYGSGDDAWGVDDGTRKQPAALRDAIRTGRRVDLGSFSREDIRRIGRSLNDANLYVLQERDSIAPDVNVGGSAGYSMDVGEAKLGIIAVASYDNEWRTRSGKQQDGIFVGDSVEFNSDYDFATTRNNVRSNGMLGLGWEYGRHTIGWTTLYVHDTLKVARSRAGRDELAGFEVRDDNTEWYARQLINNQLRGSHAFGEYDDLKIEWRAAVAKASRDVPYETGIRYELLDGYWAHDASRVQNYTRFSKVDDTVASGGVDVSWRLPIEHDFTVKGAGLSGQRPQRVEPRIPLPGAGRPAAVPEPVSARGLSVLRLQPQQRSAAAARNHRQFRCGGLQRELEGQGGVSAGRRRDHADVARHGRCALRRCHPGGASVRHLQRHAPGRRGTVAEQLCVAVGHGHLEPCREPAAALWRIQDHRAPAVPRNGATAISGPGHRPSVLRQPVPGR